MAENTPIGWTDHTFNPWWGCTKVGPGCENCYAERIANVHSKIALWGADAQRRIASQKQWSNPDRWNNGAKDRKLLVFCGSMCDVFDDHPTCETGRDSLWPLIRRTPNLVWQLLTKRPQNIVAMLPEDWGDGYENVWLGVSVENDAQAGRIEVLRHTPARLRFVSYEPAIGYLHPGSVVGMDWVIMGGESGSGFRPMKFNWARDMRDYCRSAGIPFFFKQHAARKHQEDHVLDGELIQEFPAPGQRPETESSVSNKG